MIEHDSIFSLEVNSNVYEMFVFDDVFFVSFFTYVVCIVDNNDRKDTKTTMNVGNEYFPVHIMLYSVTMYWLVRYWLPNEENGFMY